MKIRFLGAHNMESRDVRPACLLIDGVLAIDAGALSATLTFAEQLAIKAVLLTHHHYDHIKDIPVIGATFHNKKDRLPIYALPSTCAAIRYIFSYPGKFYTDMLEKPPGDPTLQLNAIEPFQPFTAAGYGIVPVTVPHSVPGVGFQITSPDGRKLFYTGDTGPGLEECWQHTSPDLLIIETTASDRFAEEARAVQHLTPCLLKEELLAFRKIKGYLPAVVTTHHFPDAREEEERNGELTHLAKELDVPILAACEEMVINL